MPASLRAKGAIVAIAALTVAGCGGTPERAHGEPESVTITCSRCMHMDRPAFEELNVRGGWVGPEYERALKYCMAPGALPTDEVTMSLSETRQSAGSTPSPLAAPATDGSPPSPPPAPPPPPEPASNGESPHELARQAVQAFPDYANAGYRACSDESIWNGYLFKAQSQGEKVLPLIRDDWRDAALRNGVSRDEAATAGLAAAVACAESRAIPLP